MDSLALTALLLRCAPQVHPTTAAALIATESSVNPYAIGVVGGQLERQPSNLPEALATASRLAADGWKFSVGLGQVNYRNFVPLGLTLQDAFEPCHNLGAMQTLLVDCYRRAGAHTPLDASALPGGQQAVLRKALSCYYSGNFITGFRHGYVARVSRASATWRTRPP